MKIFVVSKYGDSYILANKLIAENHEVIMYVRDRLARATCKHPFVTDPVADMMQDDLFIVEDDKSGKFSIKARELKRPIIGGGILVDRLVNDNAFHNKTVEGCGLRLATSETKGIPVNLGGWFCGEEFIRPYFLGFRYTRLGSGEVGQITRGMGVAGQYKMKGHIFNLLKKLEILLKTSDYQGFVNLQLFINNESAKVYKLELGLTFPMLSLVSELHGVLGNFLRKVALKSAQQVAVQPDKVGISVVWIPNLKESFSCPPTVSGVGGTIQEAVSKVYKDLHTHVKEDSYYRIDIGSNYNNYIKQLKEWDWI